MKKISRLTALASIWLLALPAACSGASAGPGAGREAAGAGTGGASSEAAGNKGVGAVSSDSGASSTASAGAQTQGGAPNGTGGNAEPSAGASGAPAAGTNSGGSSSNGGSSSQAGSGGRSGNGGASGNAGRAGSGGEAGSNSAGAGGSTSTNGCVVKLEGWATIEAEGTNGTTGGGNASPTTVTTFAELAAAARDTKPRVIVVKGTIKTTDGGGSALQIAGNKTLLGADKTATIYGGIAMTNVQNVIIRNLNINGTWPSSGPDDTVASHGSHHIWYDHLNIWNSTDGSLDITNASNYQTVSWTKFWYTSASHPHRLASLNGSGGGDHPEDWGNEKVTYHHNWWSTYVNERMPRVMYGLGHQYNNFFDAPGNSYCIGVGSYGAILVENNYFKDVNNPHQFMYDIYMDITARGNVYDNTQGSKDTGRGGSREVAGQAFEVVPFTSPPYGYTLDEAAAVPALVQKCAGPQ